MPTLANRNNNPGNLRDFSTGEFRQFASPQEGYAALLNDLETKKSGKSVTGLRPDSTLAEFASAYAPASDNNDPAQYTANIANHMGVRPDTRLSELDTGKWAEAIANAEGYKNQVSEQPIVQPQTHEQAPKTESDATFKSNEDDSLLETGLKTVGNIPKSLYKFGKGILHSLNPLNTLETVSQIPDAFKEATQANNGILPTLARTATSFIPSLYETVTPQAAQQVLRGDFGGASKTITEDPVGSIAPFLLGGVAGARGLAGKEAVANEAAMANYAKNPYTQQNIPKVNNTFQNINKDIDTTISKVGGTVANPISAVAGKVGEMASTLGKSMTSHITSLEPDTITKILKNPREFSRVAQEQASRGGLAGEIESAINTRLDALDETGKGYEAVRASNKTLQVPIGFIEETLTGKGLKIKNGKVTADSNSVTRNTSDINAIQKFYNDWKNKRTLTPNEFLNMRSDLAELSKFDKITGMGKTRAIEGIGKSLYEKANSKIRNGQLDELKSLDETYAPERTFLEQVRRDYFNPDGTLKDNAPSKIANAGNKAELLKRLEELVPGITQRIEILKAVEDIQKANGIKVGSYTRGVLSGGAIASGNIPGIVATIVTHPSNAVRILRLAGYTGEKVVPVVNALKVIGGDIQEPKSNLKTGLIGGLISQQQPTR